MVEKIKVAIITGASRGIGRAIALELASRDYKIAVNFAENKKAADSVVAEIHKLGGEALAYGADVRRRQDVERLFAAVHARFGRLDVLVNNAGVSGMGLIADLSEEGLSNTIDVNLKATIFASQLAITAFDGAGGSIINISSALVAQPLVAQGLYAATKSGVEMITRVLAQELGARKIRVNAVAPGPTETDLLQIDDQIRGYLVQKTALGRIGLPEDIARVVGFLASDAAGWITGQVIATDGGIRL